MRRVKSRRVAANYHEKPKIDRWIMLHLYPLREVCMYVFNEERVVFVSENCFSAIFDGKSNHCNV